MEWVLQSNLFIIWWFFSKILTNDTISCCYGVSFVSIFWEKSEFIIWSMSWNIMAPPVLTHCGLATLWWLWSWSALVQLLTSHLFSAKPIPESMLTYCQLDPQEQTSMTFSTNLRTFHSRKCIWKCRLQIGGHLFRLQWLEPDTAISKHKN